MTKQLLLLLLLPRDAMLTRNMMSSCVRPSLRPSVLPSQKVAQNENFFTYFCVAFYIFVAGNRRHFKFAMSLASPSLRRQTVPEMGVVTSRGPL